MQIPPTLEVPLPPRVVKCRGEVREAVIRYCLAEMRRKESQEISFSAYLHEEDVGFPSYLIVSVCKALVFDGSHGLVFQQVSKKGAFIVKRVPAPLLLSPGSPQTIFSGQAVRS